MVLRAEPHDYIEAWLAQLLAETRWIAQFDAASCVNVLERACPDYKGLHVNLYDLLLPHENELAIACVKDRVLPAQLELYQSCDGDFDADPKLDKCKRVQ